MDAEVLVGLGALKAPRPRQHVVVDAAVVDIH